MKKVPVGPRYLILSQNYTRPKGLVHRSIKQRTTNKRLHMFWLGRLFVGWYPR